jgi:diguanylate cyclase (GGDEF)-like protein
MGAGQAGSRLADMEERGPPLPQAAGLRQVLDVLCPMHLLLGEGGEILHAGPTLRRLRPTPLTGRAFLDLFTVTRPRAPQGMADLLRAEGGTLRLMFRDHPATAFKGCVLRAPEGIVVNLSFGISILDAVRDYALSSADFAPTDMTVEMLYLVEAKTAAMEESRKLNLRLRGAMVAAEEQALTDTLTGLANRRALEGRLTRLQQEHDGFALMHLDLDRFKAVNDTLGHAAGDQVLRHVATILSEETRSGDTVARVGGDEFVLLFPGLQDRSHLDRIATRIIERLDQPIPYGDSHCHVSCSIGTVLSGDYRPGDGGRMMADADAALYQAKGAGRACHRFFQP